MAPTVFRPDLKLRHKFFVTALLIWIPTLAFLVFMGVVIGSDEGGTQGVLVGILIATLLSLVGVVPVLLLIPFYYRSLQYEIHDDEVIVRAGVITKSVKHVPFRTVTNLKVKRGPLDRLFGLGTLNIQTAGMSGQSGAEESLIGLPNYQQVYEQVATALRRFRGAMTPAQAGEELVPPSDATLAAILAELKVIRQAIEKS